MEDAFSIADPKYRRRVVLAVSDQKMDPNHTILFSGSYLPLLS